MRRYTSAHILMWELVHGPVAEGLVLDHLCMQPGCVNPDHLEPVTHKENLRRARDAYSQDSRGE